MKNYNIYYIFIFVLFCSVINAQLSNGLVNRKAEAIRIAESPIIDGDLSDPIWSKVNPITDFIQDEPNNLGIPSEKTEVRIAYNEEALFVAVRLFDKKPGLIKKRLSKRDDWMRGFEAASDWFTLDIDSRYDQQTAFTFAVNASGVKVDAVVFDDSDYDGEWNANWFAETKIDDSGWTIEYKIPFSILRFSSIDNSVWGLNMSRYIYRKNETITWVPRPYGTVGLSSKYGKLSGISVSNNQKRVEYKSYFLAGNSKIKKRYVLRKKNPIDIDIGPEWIYQHIENDTAYTYRQMGIDIKYGLGSNATLDFAYLPDFGQVEADPEDINLTYYETYFQERRPFFMENSTLFDTPIELFYSRRIGEEIDSIRINNLKPKPVSETQIITATKLTGQDSQNLYYGLIHAITENKFSNSENYNLNYYTIFRLLKEYTHSNVGFLATNLSNIVGSSNMFSIDWLAYLLDNRLVIDAQYAKSNHLGEIGEGISAGASYFAPSIYKLWIETEYFDKNFNINSTGYMYRNNLNYLHYGIDFRKQKPTQYFQYANLSLSSKYSQNLDNILLNRTIQINGDIILNNYWEISAGLNTSEKHNDDRLTYDSELRKLGPISTIPFTTGIFYSIATDSRSLISFEISQIFGQNSFGDRGITTNANVKFNPLENIELSFDFNTGNSNETYHWLEITEAKYNENTDSTINHYMFSNSENLFEVYTLRASTNMSRDISLELYSEYYKNKNQFSNYTELLDGNEYPIDNLVNYNPYTITENDSTLLDPNVYPGLFSKYGSLNTNIVLRWEFLPGSTIYAVYEFTHSVNGKWFNNFFDFINYKRENDFEELMNSQSLFIKISYWFE
jgi:hypothetical protein